MINWRIAFICIFLANAFLPGIASDGIRLVLEELPNREVTVTTNTSTRLEMDVIAGKEILKRYEDAGMKMPFKFSTFSRHKITTITGEPDSHGNYEFQRTVVDAASFSEDVEGNRFKVPNKMEDLIGVTVLGVISNKRNYRVTGFTGREISEELQSIFTSVFESMQFPESPKQVLNIGDSYSTTFQMDLPIPGQKPLKINGVSKNIYKKQDGDLALFDIEMSFTILGMPNNLEVDFDGTGTGNTTYNTATKIEEKSEIDMNMKGTFSAKSIKFITHLSSNTLTYQNIKK